MEWVSKLRGQTVAIDTAPLIYFIEQHPDYIEHVLPFFTSVAAGEIRVVTSTVTLLEVLVHPLRRSDEALAHQYNDILLPSPNVSTLPVTYATAQEASELRARHNLKTPDAIQLAIAVSEGAAALLTNDRDFPHMLGIEILRLRDLSA